MYTSILRLSRNPCTHAMSMILSKISSDTKTIPIQKVNFRKTTPTRPHPPAVRVICCSCPVALRVHSLREVRVHSRTAESWNAPANRVESSEKDRALRLIKKNSV